MTTVVFFPTTPNPAPDTMNYTIVVLGGVLILAFTYFYFPVYGGVHWFEGPIRNVSALVERKVEGNGADVSNLNEDQVRTEPEVGKGQQKYDNVVSSIVEV